ncbi:hypothetical protein Sjap_009651 [Stephania japonica]|uniref:RRM domain-containing protein n=1 Tax=Stephania japonica TaxID=461633 RepID=A0AAP0J7W6_9MAGN
MSYQWTTPGPGSGSGSSSSSGFQGLQSPFGDTTYTKVFVGGLAWETQSDTLRCHFEQYGEILEAVVITDKNSGRSKGYGFVTFRDPESAWRSCSDPNPVIDGRRANCNLASLGRPRPPPSYGYLRPMIPYIRNAQGSRAIYVGGPTFQQPVPYSYQQGFTYPPYGFTTYGSEYSYPQGVVSPYVGQQYFQIYGAPGTVGSAIYPFGQIRQAHPGTHAYSAVHGYAMPGHHYLQAGGSNINEVPASPIPTLQATYPTGNYLVLSVAVAPVPPQSNFVVPAHSQTFTQGSGSDQVLRLQRDLEWWLAA